MKTNPGHVRSIGLIEKPILIGPSIPIGLTKYNYHREWFHATPELLGAVRNILDSGISFARANLKETGQIRSRLRSPETRARMSESLKATWASRKEYRAELQALTQKHSHGRRRGDPA